MLWIPQSSSCVVYPPHPIYVPPIASLICLNPSSPILSPCVLVAFIPAPPCLIKSFLARMHSTDTVAAGATLSLVGFLDTLWSCAVLLPPSLLDTHSPWGSVFPSNNATGVGGTCRHQVLWFPPPNVVHSPSIGIILHHLLHSMLG